MIALENIARHDLCGPDGEPEGDLDQNRVSAHDLLRETLARGAEAGYSAAELYGEVAGMEEARADWQAEAAADADGWRE